MAERDPFGRLPNENPLEGLGSLSDGSTGQAEPVAESWSGKMAEPAPVDASAASASPSQADVRKATQDALRRPQQANPGASAEAVRQAAQRMVEVTQTMNPEKVVDTVRRISKIVRTVVVIAVFVIVISIAVSIFAASSGDDSQTPSPVQTPAQVEPGSGSGSGSGSGEPVAEAPIPAAPAQPVPNNAPVPVGLGKHSLLARGNLAPALRRLQRSGLGRLQSLRIAAERIDVQLLTREGRLRSVQLRYTGELRRFSLSGAGFGHLTTLPFSDVDPAAPQRLARGAAERLKRPVSQVDYVVRINAGPGTAWTVVMLNGGQFIGDARGQITRRIN